MKTQSPGTHRLDIGQLVQRIGSNFRILPVVPVLIALTMNCLELIGASGAPPSLTGICVRAPGPNEQSASLAMADVGDLNASDD